MSVAAKLIAGGAARQKPWNIARAEYVRNFSGNAAAVFFKPDGVRMYTLLLNSISEYRLSTPWDVTSAQYVRNLSVSAQLALAAGIFFKPDGTFLYIIDEDSEDINEYSLSIPWNISSAIYVRRLVLTFASIPDDLFFRADGLKLYVLDRFNKVVREFDLSPAWDLSSAAIGPGFSMSSEASQPCGMFFKPDGSQMYISDDPVFGGVEKVLQYQLSTPWDISTAEYTKALSVADQESAPCGLYFHPDGTRMYFGSDGVNEYRLAKAERSASFSTAGTYTLTVPNTITSVEINLLGGAGGGASGYSTVTGEKNPTTTNYFGGDGGSGALATKTLSVTPGETLTIVVGAGGTGGAPPNVDGTSPNPGTDGTDSTVSQSGSVVARADAGSGAPSATDGAGGLAASSTGDTTTNGILGAGGDGGFGPYQAGDAGEAGSVLITW